MCVRALAGGDANTTVYHVFAGPGAIFENGKDRGLADITDGTTNTLLIVESTKAVPWTKPDDLTFDPAAAPSLFGAGSAHPGGFIASTADGAVRFIGNSIDPNVLRSMITCSGGEVVNSERIVGGDRQAPAPGRGAGLRVDPNKLPRADELRRLLFPASMALVVDREGASLVFRDPIPTISSPAASGVLIGLLLPAVQSAREAARRAQCVNNLKQIALAMLNYESATLSFPRPAITDKAGKPLLSWRVAILPYIERAGLYEKFKLDEPWDSPHNLALLKEMPANYECPSHARGEPYTTTYRLISGKGALFENGRDVKIADVTDGLTGTLLAVEAAEAVPWTKPDDLSFDPAAAPSLLGTGSSHPGGFNAAFGDGSVRFFRNSIDPNVFRSLITRAGGEVVRIP